KGKSELVDDLGMELALIPDRLQQHHYIGRLAQLLASVAGTFQLRESDLHEAVTRARLRKQAQLRQAAAQTAAAAEPEPEPEPAQSTNRMSGKPGPVATGAGKPLHLDAEDFLVMRALRYLDDVALWSQT